MCVGGGRGWVGGWGVGGVGGVGQSDAWRRLRRLYPHAQNFRRTRQNRFIMFAADKPIFRPGEGSA